MSNQLSAPPQLKNKNLSAIKDDENGTARLHAQVILLCNKFHK